MRPSGIKVISFSFLSEQKVRLAGFKHLLLIISSPFLCWSAPHPPKIIIEKTVMVKRASPFFICFAVHVERESIQACSVCMLSRRRTRPSMSTCFICLVLYHISAAVPTTNRRKNFSARARRKYIDSPHGGRGSPHGGFLFSMKYLTQIRREVESAEVLGFGAEPRF